MTIDSDKYHSLLSNLEVELIVRLQTYAEFFSLAYLIVFHDMNDVKRIVSQFFYELKEENNITFPATFPTEMIVESAVRKAMWFFRECDFTSTDKRSHVYAEENKTLYELLKTYKLYKQVQDLK